MILWMYPVSEICLFPNSICFLDIFGKTLLLSSISTYLFVSILWLEVLWTTLSLDLSPVEIWMREIKRVLIKSICITTELLWWVILSSLFSKVILIFLSLHKTSISFSTSPILSNCLRRTRIGKLTLNSSMNSVSLEWLRSSDSLSSSNTLDLENPSLKSLLFVKNRIYELDLNLVKLEIRYLLTLRRKISLASLRNLRTLCSRLFSYQIPNVSLSPTSLLTNTLTITFPEDLQTVSNSKAKTTNWLG
jgi:hypothetical protein